MVQIVYVVSEPDIRVELEVVVRIAPVVVNVLLGEVVVDIGLLYPNARFDIIAFLLMHIVQVTGINFLSPLRSVSEPLIYDGVLPPLNVIGNRDPAFLKPRPSLQAAAAQRSDVVDLDRKRMFFGDEVGCVRADANG